MATQITQSPNTELLQRFFSVILPRLGDPRTSNTVRGVGPLDLPGGGQGLAPTIEDLINAVVGEDRSRFEEDGDSDPGEEGPQSSQDVSDVSTDNLIDALTQSMKPDSIGETIMKGIGSLVSVTGLPGFAEGLRNQAQLSELQERGVLDAGLTVEDLKNVNVRAAIDVSEAFESFGGIGDPGASDPGGPGGGGFGGPDDEGIGGESSESDINESIQEAMDAAIDESFGEEGFDESGFGDEPGGTPGDPGQDPEGGFDDGENGDNNGGAGGGGPGGGGGGVGDDPDDSDEDDDPGTSDFQRGTSFVRGPKPKQTGEAVPGVTLHEGEAVLNRELVQLLGPDLINTLNQMAQGRVRSVNRRKV